MHCFQFFAIGALAFAQMAIAQSITLFFAITPPTVIAGQPSTFKYAAPDLSAPVTITLRKGDPANLETISVLSTSTTGGTYVWTPALTLVNSSNYTLMITQGSEVNYSPMIILTGGVATNSTSASSAFTIPSTTSLFTASSISATTNETITTTALCSTSSPIYPLPIPLNTTASFIPISGGVSGLNPGGPIINATSLTFVSPSLSAPAGRSTVTSVDVTSATASAGTGTATGTQTGAGAGSGASVSPALATSSSEAVARKGRIGMVEVGVVVLGLVGVMIGF